MPEDPRSKRVLDLCDQALGFAESERDKFLAQECKDDAQLRDSVKSVLIAINEAGQLFEGGVSLDTAATDFVGRQIGSYQVLSCLGTGGMGSVYLARRHEEGFDQRVAIKFVHGHMMARELIERFNAERQILATLNHPYIAALIDGGTTSDGIPFLVMEYVDGIQIDEYCDANKLDIRARVKLVQKVAMAVQSAHQSLIVHRDLKPSNILITADGIPKLLDFGIAKLIQADDDGSGNTTVFGHQAMTPDYASPEQILENRVTTASDVYTLGVLTYLLLVGELPYRIQMSSHREMMSSVEGLTVPKPSTRLSTVASDELRGNIADRRATTPSQLQRSLQGDLDNILLMALRHEPDRRYYSVAQFSEDLERYLSGLPVIARGDSARYRTRKFLQRNWLACGSAALIVLSLSAGLVGYASQANEAQRQRDIARVEAAHAENTVNFLKDVLFVGDPYATSENEQTIDDVLTYAAAHVDEKYADDTASRAKILMALGDISTSRSDYEGAEKLSSAALQLYQEELGVFGNDAANTYRVHALALRYLDEYELASVDFAKAIELYAQAAEPDWAGLSQAYDEMALVQSDLANNEEAAKFFNLALTTYYDHNVDEPAQLVATLSNLGVNYLDTANFELADKTFSEALDIAEKSNVSEGQLAMLLQNQAGAMANLGRMDDSISNYVEAVDLLTRSIGPTHRDTIVSITSLAATHREMGNLEEAEIVIRQAIEAVEKSSSPNQFVLSYVQYMAGSILCDKGNPAEGMVFAQKALENRRELLPAGHWAITASNGIVGACLIASGEYTAAEQVLLQVHSSLHESLGEKHEATVGAHARVNKLYTAWGKPEKAEKWASRPP